MAPYQRLTLMEREEFSRLLAAGYGLRAAAQALQRAPSTRRAAHPALRVPAHHRAH